MPFPNKKIYEVFCVPSLDLIPLSPKLKVKVQPWVQRPCQ